MTDLTSPGTLRSGREFATHGAILLDNFDVLEHLQTSHPTNAADASADDAPVSVLRASRPDKRDAGPSRSRSWSPPCRRSARLRGPVDDSLVCRLPTRAARRAAEQAALGTPLKRVVRKHVANAEPLHISTSPADYPVTSTGWGGIREKVTEQREYSLVELQQDFGMTLVPWDGQSSCPLVDNASRVIGVLGGRPKGRDYLRQTDEAARQLESARHQLNFRPDQANGRRGAFASVSYGISYGGGQQVPGNLTHTPAVSKIMEVLFEMQCFSRIAGFANGIFKAWNPAVHALYTLTLDALTYDHNPALKRNFPATFSAFAAATLNFGPVTVTYPHIDALNLAWGWCAITALGNFNPDVGGHLVLWDLKLVIRFPAGSTILIPSAILRHSNIAIASGETRFSFTQYTAAGLFRWVDNDFKSDVTVAQEIRGNLQAQEQRALARSVRWEEGINSFHRWSPCTA
ncbi:hypothetical protein B0H15DRAFT_794250 [Mycena belliarum]|uniref:Uncharacterized protein n=1 Tax=Mycena belliarum TaxID=1033014 RepID=A0AAD6TMQ8_9AGAR|nr:hypothetical protein B0H15DRAFT_794250 [Mycena belliae]